jgi:hypothetical protein
MQAFIEGNRLSGKKGIAVILQLSLLGWFLNLIVVLFDLVFTFSKAEYDAEHQGHQTGG